MRRCIGHADTNRSKTDHAQFFTSNFTSGICLFLLFGQLCKLCIVFFRNNPVYSAVNIAACHKHPCQYQLFHAVCVGARRIKYDYALFCALIQRNIVNAGAGACHYFQAVRQIHVVHRSGTYERRLRIFDIFHFLVTLFQYIESYLCNRI